MYIRIILLSLLILGVLSIKVKCQNNCFPTCIEKLKEIGFSTRTDSISIKRKKIMYSLIGCDMPEFIVETVSGEIINSNELNNKIVVINFWFLTCAPCIAEIPGLNKLVNEYKNEEIVFLGFTKDDKETINDDFLPKHKFDYELIPVDNEIIDTFCIYFGWPSNMVFDTHGKLRVIFTGGKTDENAKEEVYSKLKTVIDKCINDR